MILVCFPYAGASGSIFLRCEKYMGGKIKIFPLDPPGRGRRMAEPLCETIEETVVDLKKQILDLFNTKNEQYAICGHSMGSLLAYELLHELLKSDFPMPVHVFLSGKNPPDVPVKERISQMENSEFIERILKLGGTDPKFFESQTLTNVYIPILRKDLKMLETYEHKNNRKKLPVNLTFFFAVDDAEVDIEKIKHWQDFITGNFQLYYFPGGHFFFLDHIEKMATVIVETLSETENSIPY
jgi:surfactin synthase thioesterase subunit